MFIILWKSSEVEIKVGISLVIFHIINYRQYKMEIMIQKFHTGLYKVYHLSKYFSVTMKLAVFSESHNGMISSTQNAAIRYLSVS